MSEEIIQTPEEEVIDIDLDQHFAQQEIYDDELEGDDEFDPMLSDLTLEEKALLQKIEKKRLQQDHILTIFRELETRPSDEQIEEMKQRCGDVYLVSLSEKENFLFRSLKRLEWRTLMQKIDKLDNFKKSEAIVMKGILFPQLNQQNINVLSAGTVDTLKELILQASNFMAPEYATQLVRKL
jgi:hypothetical protein